MTAATHPTEHVPEISRADLVRALRAGSITLIDVLPLALAGLALITLGNFSGVTAAQLGVASSTERDRGLASALYFSAYYVAGSLGAYLPGLAFERWEWPGVAGLCLAAYGIGATALLVARRPGRLA